MNGTGWAIHWDYRRFFWILSVFSCLTSIGWLRGVVSVGYWYLFVTVTRLSSFINLTSMAQMALLKYRSQVNFVFKMKLGVSITKFFFYIFDFQCKWESFFWFVSPSYWLPSLCEALPLTWQKPSKFTHLTIFFGQMFCSKYNWSFFQQSSFFIFWKFQRFWRFLFLSICYDHSAKCLH